MNPTLESVVRGHIESASWSPVGDAESRRTDELLLRSFRGQAESIPPYGAYVRHLGVDPAAITRWHPSRPVLGVQEP